MNIQPVFNDLTTQFFDKSSSKFNKLLQFFTKKKFYSQNGKVVGLFKFHKNRTVGTK